MSDVFTYTYHKNQPNVGKSTIHGWYGLVFGFIWCLIKFQGVVG